MSVDSLWGEFKQLEEEETPVEETTEEVKKPKVKEEEEEEEEEEEAEEEAPVEEPKPEESKSKKPKDDTEKPSRDLSETFEEIAEGLEAEELLFLDPEKKYDGDSKGFKQMMEDNMLAYGEKLKKDFAAQEASIRRSYEEKSAPKIADMDPSDDNDAMDLLHKYYLETGFNEDEVEEKLQEVKNLENLEKEAIIAQRFLGKKEAKEDQLKEAAKEKDNEDRNIKVKEYITSVKSEIDEMEEISGFKLSNKMKTDFKDYLFKFDKEGKSPAQKAGVDPKRRLRLAFMDFVDFNKKDFEIKAKTELADEYSKKASRFTSTQSKARGKTVSKESDTPDQGLQPGFLDFWQSNQ